LRGAFGESFGVLPMHTRYLDGLRLGLLVVAIGLLIAPAPDHRIVEGGQDSGGLHQFAAIIADLALLPFALALSVDLLIGTSGSLARTARLPSPQQPLFWLSRCRTPFRSCDGFFRAKGNAG
jgi:hypothetical protein